MVVAFLSYFIQDDFRPSALFGSTRRTCLGTAFYASIHIRKSWTWHSLNTSIFDLSTLISPEEGTSGLSSTFIFEGKTTGKYCCDTMDLIWFPLLIMSCHVRPPVTIVFSCCVYNSNFTMVYGTEITSNNELVTGANLNQHSHHWGASHCNQYVWHNQQ